ncbi:MAG: YicC family protein [Deltaproteobacteria bacterium]|nr:YicC family protein [Deltaproteobacteria bacterium]MCL5278251.1 YicC family protein [Deltaproteobacteria bacterium]
MKSMTGYGISTGTVEGFGLSCELKTLNGKYLDVNVRLPRELSVFEVPLARWLKGQFSRGSVYLNISIRGYEYRKRWPFTIDTKKAGLYIELLKTIKKALGLRGRITVNVLTQSPEFFLKDDKPVSESAINDMINIAEEAAKKTLLMRETEGEEIKKEVQSLIDVIAAVVSGIEGKIPSIVEQYKQKAFDVVRGLKQSFDTQVSPEAVVGNYIDRIDINEEVKRIQSHLRAFSQLLEAKGAIGKKMEFFTQELIRELNTIGSKVGEAGVTVNVIDAKSTVERIKELAQNVE